LILEWYASERLARHSLGQSYIAPNGELYRIADSKALAIRLKSKMITRFDLRSPNRILSEIFDAIILVPNDHRVARIDDRYVESAVVFTLK
jgi:hypothetical protein